MDDILDSSMDGNAEPEVDIIGALKAPTSSDEVFAFARTLSRLKEMQTQTYLEKVGRERPTTQQASAFRFFSQFERDRAVVTLSEGDARQVFDRYDANMDNELDIKDEFPLFLEDMQLFLSGHRHVPEEVRRSTIRALDPQQKGKISWTSFRNFVQENGLVAFVGSD